MVAYAPEFFLNFLLAVTIYSTKLLGLLLGTSVTSSGEIMTVNGFAMRIITQCTAIHYVIILSSAILLFTRHTFSYRMTGVVLSTFVVITANALRLIVTGVIGSISWDAFVLVHDYLWVAAFSLLILGIWMVWVERKLSITREAIRRSVIIVFFCTTAYGLLYLAMPLYGRVMAAMASPLFKLLVSESQTGITFTGDMMLFSSPQGAFTANFSTDLMIFALYLGLVLSEVSYGKAVIRPGIIGLIILLCVSAVVIAAGGAIAVNAGKVQGVMFLWSGHGILLSLFICLSLICLRPHKS